MSSGAALLLGAVVSSFVFVIFIVAVVVLCRVPNDLASMPRYVRPGRQSGHPAARIVDALAPPRCGGCWKAGPSPCAACFAAMRRPPPLPPPPGLSGLVALLAYEGPGRDLVARIKYRNARASVPWLASALAAHIDAATVDVVTWVPTTARRRRGRGFDHARVLAAAVARELGRPCVGLLHRGPGPPQTGRSAEERRRRPPLRPTARARAAAPPRVLVVDDVCTTGASLGAAAHALREAGTGLVLGAVAARTLRHGLVGPPLKVVIRRTDPLEG